MQPRDGNARPPVPFTGEPRSDVAMLTAERTTNHGRHNRRLSSQHGHRAQRPRSNRVGLSYECYGYFGRGWNFHDRGFDHLLGSDPYLGRSQLTG